MLFTAQEFGLMQCALQTEGIRDNEFKMRSFEQLKEGPIAVAIADKLDGVMESFLDTDGKPLKDPSTKQDLKKFVDKDLEFSTEEKANLLKYLDRNWAGISRTKAYQSVKPKLE